MAAKSYARVNWAGYPSKTTPLSADNLNVMDKGIDDVDTKATNLETRQDTYEADMTDVKGDILDLNESLNNMVDTKYDTTTGKPMWKEQGADTWNFFSSRTSYAIYSKVTWTAGQPLTIATTQRATEFEILQIVGGNLYKMTNLYDDELHEDKYNIYNLYNGSSIYQEDAPFTLTDTSITLPNNPISGSSISNVCIYVWY